MKAMSSKCSQKAKAKLIQSPGTTHRQCSQNHFVAGSQAQPVALHVIHVDVDHACKLLVDDRA